MNLTLTAITEPFRAANTRGEGIENIQTLQKLIYGDGVRTEISGYSIKWAVRDNMDKCGAKMWRVALPEGPSKANPSGYGYGPNRVLAMKNAIPASADEYDDTLAFGYMVAPKGNDEDAKKSAGLIEFSAAISTTLFQYDQAFVRGLKADGQTNPFGIEKHYTRYAFTINANLDGLKARPEVLGHVLHALRGLRVGGSHSSNASEMIPDLLMWRFHREPGCGGLYMGILNAPTESDIDLTEIKCKLRKRDITDACFAGCFIGSTDDTPTVKAGLEMINTQALPYMK